MNFGPEIVVVVSSSSVPTKFRAEDSPTWGVILQQLHLEHGPGVLKDGQGYNKLLNNASMDQAVPLGTYDYITETATGAPGFHITQIMLTQISLLLKLCIVSSNICGLHLLQQA